MNIAICDDDATELSRLHEMIDGWAVKCGAIAKVQEFSRGEVLCNTLLDDKKYDVFILDVMMPEMDGLCLARKLRASEYVSDEVPIIFLTSSKDFAVESYEVRAFHYLLKPVNKRKMEEVLDSARGFVRKKTNDVMIVRTAEGEYYLNRSDICYVAFQNRVMDFVCADKRMKSLSVQDSFKNASASFDEDSRFYRCGASLIVNLSQIRSIDKSVVTFANNSEYTVPRASAKGLYKAWLDHWLKDGGAR